MKNNNENTIKMESKEVKQCREKIVEIINDTENQRYLEFIYKLLLSFKRKWGV